jgi:hypothetical protein
MKGKFMNNKFDELAKGLAQSATRRQALKRFGVGMAGMALACFGLTNSSQADPRQPCTCGSDADCQNNYYCATWFGFCAPKWCDPTGNGPCCCHCPTKGKAATAVPTCNANYYYCSGICGLLEC